MHSLNIAHRDLKPENILMQDRTSYKTERPRIRVADFGFATHLNEDNETLEYKLGTSKYKAPELVDPNNQDRHNEKVDIWAIGCIVFEIFARKKAFNQRTDEATNKAILIG